MASKTNRTDRRNVIQAETDSTVITLKAQINDIEQLLTTKRTQLENRYQQITQMQLDQQIGIPQFVLNPEFCSNDTLPREILCMIFGYCETINSLLNCRLVCKTWKTSVDDPKFRNKFTVNLDNWSAFLKSTLINKVTSVRIDDPLNAGKLSDWFTICRKIGERLQIAKFDFAQVMMNTKNDQKIQRCRLLVKMLLESAPGLKELHMNGADIFTLAKATTQTMPVHQNLESLVVLAKAITLNKIIFSFPNLRRIEMLARGDQRSDYEVYTLLQGYIDSRPGTLQEIVINGYAEHEDLPDLWFQFLFYCTYRDVKVTRKYDGVDITRGTININTIVVRFEETPEAPINEKTCQHFEKVTLEIYENDKPALNKIGYCKNINDLAIGFHRSVELEELYFLTKLKKLTKLKLTDRIGNYSGFGAHAQEEEDIVVNIQLCPHNCFDCGFPLLQALNIYGNLFGQIAEEAFSNFYIYFPNLKSISFTNVTTLPEDIFIHLSKLDSIQQIQIDTERDGLICVTDEMFTRHCERPQNNTSGRGGDLVGELVPAIAAFKCLTSLRIQDCKGLTDKFILQGIVCNQTLREVILCGLQGQLTRASFVALRKANFQCNNTYSHFKREVCDLI